MGPLLALAGEFLGPLLAEGSVAVRGLTAELNAADKGLGKLGKQFGLTEEQASSFFDGLGIETDPFKAAGAALGKIKDILEKSTVAAMNFNHEFMRLENMNLDKSDKEIEELNDQILRLSIENGLNPSATVRDFGIIQSLTGRYGDEVGTITDKINRFSNAVGANQSAMLESTAKGLDMFRVGGNDIESYLTSQAKTVKLTGLSYDGLAEAQGTYMRAAANAGAGFNDANKFFAGFNAITHDAVLAADMTKAAFEGFTDPRIKSQLHEMGIGFGDADDTLSQLRDSMRTMNSDEFSGFLSKLGGSDEMNAAMNTLRTGGSQMGATFANFDNSKIDSKDILANEEADPLSKMQKINNQLEGIKTSFGQMFMPLLGDMLTFISSKLAGMADFFTAINDKSGTFAIQLQTAGSWFRLIFESATFGLQIFTRIIGKVVAFVNQSELLQDIGKGVNSIFSGLADMLGAAADKIMWVFDKMMIGMKLVEGFYRIAKAVVAEAVQLLSELGAKIYEKVSGPIGRLYDWMVDGISGMASDIYGAVSGAVSQFYTYVSDSISGIYEHISQSLSWVYGSIMESDVVQTISEKVTQFYDSIAGGIRRLYNSVMSNETVQKVVDYLQGVFSKISEWMDRIINRLSQSLDRLMGPIRDVGEYLGFGGGDEEVKKVSSGGNAKAVAEKLASPLASIKESLEKANPELEKEIKTINDGGKSVRNVTVTIQKLVETINNNVSDVAEGMRKSEDIVLEGLVRIVNDAEMALGNSNSYY